MRRLFVNGDAIEEGSLATFALLHSSGYHPVGKDAVKILLVTHVVYHLGDIEVDIELHEPPSIDDLRRGMTLYCASAHGFSHLLSLFWFAQTVVALCVSSICSPTHFVTSVGCGVDQIADPFHCPCFDVDNGCNFRVFSV